MDDVLVPVDGGEVERRVALERKQTHSLPAVLNASQAGNKHGSEPPD